MRLQSNRVVRAPGVRALARLARRDGTGAAGTALAARAARVGVDRMRRAVDLAVARSPQSLFLRELVAQPGTVGAICASSPRLAARMAALVDAQQPGLVVELGGGTGVITAALLAHGIAPARLVVVEQSAALADHLRRRFPGVCVLQGDAADIGHWHASGHMPVGGDGQPLPVHTIVSGLPLLSIPQPVRQRILRAGAQLLVPHGRLLQFTYALRGASPWQTAGLHRQHSERVLANLPPARIDVLGRVAFV